MFERKREDTVKPFYWGFAFLVKSTDLRPDFAQPDHTGATSRADLREFT